ncbi:hypothetical protein Patl1_13417 [Pistacia atlantica]|uniref:Uncharacterized protein n=1 Tax=Pistacia atlantica TaxID=434234 RepID=A0ACC1AVB7_9ROSI|nr:hypothetical protein Patl1_13417 [Pistacia atlantica]
MQSVVDLIKTHFGQKNSATDPPVLPIFPVPSHQEPHFSSFIESEAAGYKMAVNELKTVKEYKEMLTESMFLHALNQRFFKISRRKDPPYFSCSATADDLVRPLKACIISAACKERGTLEALESEREVAVVRALLMSEIESAYLERDQMQSTSLRDELLQHFLCNEPVIGIEHEARLQKTILPRENIVQRFEYQNIGATELILSNGMRVCYKCTDFLDDQVHGHASFSYGGLSELPESEYVSCSIGSTIAGEIGVFGHKPSVLMDMLAGKRVEVGTKLGAYMRTFSGDCSPSDLETALQLVYQLFTTNVTPGEEEVKIVMQMAEEAIHAQERDPYTAFANRVKEINYGNSYFFRPIKIRDLQKVDPIKACDYFNSCFKDPSTFTVVIVGNIDPTIAIPLILQYLGGIPKPPEPVLHFNRDKLKGLPFTFPTSIIRQVVHSPMVEAQCSVQLCFPVELKNGTMVEEINYVGFLSKFLETKMMQVLRFKHGQIYSAGVSVFLGGNKHSRTGDVDLALDEILHLQEEGPSDQDVSTILELEQRAHENGLQENYHWLDRILCSYQSRIYSGNVGTSFEIQDEARLKVRTSLTSSTLQSALQRMLPYPLQ